MTCQSLSHYTPRSVTLVDKEILTATVNGDYCAIGNNDCSADFLKFQ
ncbi:MAG: hypothetical protein ABSF44_00010 [Candidatus Bathyarchaeia archaeon]